MPEDYRFKRIEEDCAADKVTDHSEKVREFKWGDIEDETEKETEKETEFLTVNAKELNECAALLASHLLSTISGEHFSELDTSGMKFAIPIDSGMHVLLRSRFEEKWDLDSRLDMFMKVGGLLAFMFSENTEKRAILDTKIQEVLPPTHSKKLVLTEVNLVDDAMIVGGESNMISIEVPLSFAANK